MLQSVVVFFFFWSAPSAICSPFEATIAGTPKWEVMLSVWSDTNLLAGIRSPEGIGHEMFLDHGPQFQPRYGIIQNMGTKNTILNIMIFPVILCLTRPAGYLADV